MGTNSLVMPMTVCHEHTKLRKQLSVRNYTKDEGRPLGAALQEEASNHLKLRRLRALVVSVKEKAELDFVRYMLRRRTKVNL